MLESLFNKFAGLKQSLQFYAKETPTQLFSCEYCKAFRNCFFIEQLRWLPLLVDKITVQYQAICLRWSKTMGWFLLTMFLIINRVCSLHNISRNHSKPFLLINLEKAKTCPKWNTVARAISPDMLILTV